MGLLNSSLHIGRTALLSYQGALQVVGNNIASAGSPDYTRLTPQLDPLSGLALSRGLQSGAGVELTEIQRNIDEALESRLRLAVSDHQAAAARQTTLSQLESQYDDVNGTGLASRLRSFFNSFDELQNSPEDLAVRDLVLAGGASLAGEIQAQRARLVDLGGSLDSQIGGLVERANERIAVLADLNERITRAEAGGPAQATGLRDQRDGVLRDLAELFDVTTHEQPNGALNVYVGSEALVQGSVFRRLTSEQTVDGEFRRTSLRFLDTRGELPLVGGRIEGLIRSRDQEAYARVAELDQFASALVADVNRIHADGQGLVGLTAVIGSAEVFATNVPLDQPGAGLDQPLQSGSFYLVVTDNASQTPVARRIEVTSGGTSTGTTLENLVDAINNSVDGVTASITSDRRLSLVADTGSSFTLGHDGAVARADSSGLLAALGVNTFFSGHDATDIAVNEVLVDDPRRVAAAATALPGDGIIAGRIAALDSKESDLLNGLSLSGFYNGIVSGIAVAASEANDDSTSAEVILSSLQAQRESISGVSLDEEAISLVKYERAFQGVSRFVTVVDNLIRELVTLVR